jgi:NAD(P)-dependent dehydrogenase (short-subunit alcohol dehydrogenase family)
VNDMNERVALVTGGTRGIGAAISSQLAQHGARIAALYNRDTQAADAFAKEASDKGLTISLHQATSATRVTASGSSTRSCVSTDGSTTSSTTPARCTTARR